MLPELHSYEELRRVFQWCVPRQFNIAEAACGRWARREPDREALIFKTDDGDVRCYSYADLERGSSRLANVFKAHGIGCGDRVGILLPQRPETLFAHFALYKLGAIAVPLANLFGVEALRFRLGDCNARGLITAQGSLERVAAIRPDLPDLRHVFNVDGVGDGAIDLPAAMERASDQCPTLNTLADDPAIIIYTSGTTGPPKGALHAHRVLLGHLPGVQFPHEFLPQPGDKIWTPADWAWIGGLINVALPALYLGVPLVGHRFEKFDPERACALLGELGVRNTFMPPTALRMVRALSDPARRYRIDLRTIFSGGETVGAALQEWAREAFGVYINEVYGQTECNLVVTSCARIGVIRPGAIGKVVPGHEVAILDGNARVLPPGKPGIIAVKAPDPVMFLGYWNRPDATRDKFMGDWLVTGDQGVMDEDGYFSFIGRDDDVITSAGYRIGPGEIEDCLIGHPAVQLAAAVGKPDPLRTEIVKAYIVLREGYEPSADLESEIRGYVREHLSAHEYPREIAFEQELPLTTTGKVIRRVLRERAREEAALADS